MLQFLFLFILFFDSNIAIVDVSVPHDIADNVKLTSDFIQEFRKKFDVDSQYRFTQPYLTILSNDIANIDLVRTISLLLEDVENERQPKKQIDLNSTQNITAVVAKRNKYMANCYAYDYKGSPRIEIVNQTELVDVLKPDQRTTNRSTPGLCVLMIVYARTCPFSAMAAPHLNALPRAFPQIRMVAVDSRTYPSLNSQYGIVGVPTLMLFHNGRPIAKFNKSDYTLFEFARFLTSYTGIKANEKMYVASTDFGGPLRSKPTDDVNFHLILSWVFLASYLIVKLLNRIFHFS